MTAAQTKAALQTILAVGDAIRDLGEVPSGHLYARLMGHMDLRTYEAIVASLKGAGVVEERNHLLRWVGPTKGSAR